MKNYITHYAFRNIINKNKTFFSEILFNNISSLKGLMNRIDAIAVNPPPLETTVVSITKMAPPATVQELVELTQAKPLQECLSAMKLVLEEQGTSNKLMLFIDPVQKQIGLIAQDVEKLIPEVVTTDNNGLKRIQYDLLTPILINAIKELNTKIEKQQKTIDSLKIRK